MNIITCDCGHVLHGADFEPIYCWNCGAWWYPVQTQPESLELVQAIPAQKESAK